MNKYLRGDALEKLRNLPDDSVDVGVTSPPYNKQENKKGWLVKHVKYNGSSDKFSESDYQRMQIAVLNELYRVIKPGGAFFYNHKIRWERGVMLHPITWLAQTDWTIRQEIVWDRRLAANIRGWRFWQVEERIYWLHKPIADNKIGVELKSRHAKLSSIWRFSPERNNPHPAPFPLILPMRAIYSVADTEDAVVIDPYCGSGTTLVAAKLLNHSFIGIDCSAEYIAMSKNRVKNCESEREACEQEKALHVVHDTFKEKKRLQKHVGRFAPTKMTTGDNKKTRAAAEKYGITG